MPPPRPCLPSCRPTPRSSSAFSPSLAAEASRTPQPHNRFGAAFTSLSGAPFTPLATVLAPADSGRFTTHPTFGAPSAERFPAFRRLDMLAEWTWAVRRVRLGGYVQLINALQRDNPLGVTSFDLVCPRRLARAVSRGGSRHTTASGPSR